ncbi:OmpH family outer membrane protein [Aquimarina sp. Aq78]|uniref:OmpH family outer membrane protein n=1 Tax=Aquimarina sp. Aq78 TaxID=1191889 RepID=UPI00131E28B1|nr:OmpH family outer membrane protein [Aquimarina sp. Aq78]
MITLLMLLVIAYLCFQQYNIKKNVIVNAQTVLENYQGFKEAQDLFEIKTKEMQDTFEKQKSTYESKSNELEIISKKLSNQERIIKKGELEVLKAKTIQLGKAIEKKVIAQEEELLQGVYNKINDFVKRYAETHDIDLIEGITNSGNIMYASDAIDITQDIIEGLNKEYVEGIKE